MQEIAQDLRVQLLAQISFLTQIEGYEDPTCKVDDINKLIELHSNQFGSDVGSELQTNIDTMKDTLDKIGSIIFGGMNYDEINSRILEIVKRVVDLKQQAEIWSPKLHDISNGWVKAQKWISDSQDALGECGAIEKLDEINDLIQRFSQLLSIKAWSFFNAYSHKLYVRYYYVSYATKTYET